jgi:hypothetical protein
MAPYFPMSIYWLCQAPLSSKIRITADGTNSAAIRERWEARKEYYAFCLVPFLVLNYSQQKTVKTSSRGTEVSGDSR